MPRCRRIYTPTPPLSTGGGARVRNLLVEAVDVRASEVQLARRLDGGYTQSMTTPGSLVAQPLAPPCRTPLRAWVVTFAGTAVNLCLGILYAWSVWKKNLIAPAKPEAGHPAGSAMS